jgi:hypothetical protein
METITCGEERIQAKEIESIGGSLNSTTDYEDTLYRSKSGRYYLKEETSIPLPPNAVFTIPRDRERVDAFLNDDKLRKRFEAMIERLQ